MDHALNWLWQGALVGIAAAAALRLPDRLRAQARYLLCWGAVLAVVALPILPWLAGADAAPAGTASGPRSAAFALSIPRAWWSSTAAVLALWAIWCGLCFLRFATAARAVRRERARCRPWPPAVEARLHHWNRMSARGRRTRLAVSASVPAAAVLGCGPPVIAVAPVLLDRLGVDQLDRLVIHEWAHVQRRDDLINLGHVAVRAVAGWHPAVWWLERQLQLEREAACDAAAVAVTGCAKRYAASLTDAASLLPRRLRSQPALGALAPTGLGRRLVRILSRREPLSPPRSAVAAAAAVMALARACDRGRPAAARRSHRGSAGCGQLRGRSRRPPRCRGNGPSARRNIGDAPDGATSYGRAAAPIGASGGADVSPRVCGGWTAAVCRPRGTCR